MTISVGKFIELRSLPVRILREQEMRPFDLPPDAFPGQDHAGLLEGLKGASLSRFDGRTVVPPVRLLHVVVENGSFFVGHRLDGTVLTADGRPIVQTAAFRDLREAGEQDETAVDAGPVQQVEDVFVGFDGAWRNYFHFLCFGLAKSFLAARRLDPSVAIALPDYGANTTERPASFTQAVFEQCIEASGLSARVTLYPPGIYRAKRIHLFWTSPGEPTDIMHLDEFRAVFETMSKSVAGTAVAPQPAEPLAKRVYLARTRAVASRLDDPASDLIDAAAERHGFARLSFEGLDLHRQVSIIGGATHLMSPHGAGLCNMLFHRGALRVLELNKPLDGGRRLRPWFLLAARAGRSPYRYLDTGDAGFSADRLEAALASFLRPD